MLQKLLKTCAFGAFGLGLTALTTTSVLAQEGKTKTETVITTETSTYVTYKRQAVYGFLFNLGGGYVNNKSNALTPVMPSFVATPVNSTGYFAAGFTGIYRNVVVGFTAQTTGQLKGETPTFTTSTAFYRYSIDLGYVVYGTDKFIVYPTVGLGGIYTDLTVYNKSAANAAAFTNSFFGASTASNSAFNLNGTLNVKYKLGDLFTVGLEGGYNYAAPSDTWRYGAYQGITGTGAPISGINKFNAQSFFVGANVSVFSFGKGTSRKSVMRVIRKRMENDN